MATFMLGMIILVLSPQRAPLLESGTRNSHSSRMFKNKSLYLQKKAIQ